MSKVRKNMVLMGSVGYLPPQGWAEDFSLTRALPLSYKDINGGPDKLKVVLLMIVVEIFKDSAGNFSNLTSTATYEDCKRRLRLYFSDLKKVKEKIIAGEIISIPYLTFQKDRRINKDKRIKNERRRHF